MIKASLLSHLGPALRQAAPQLNQLVVNDALIASFRLERPRNLEHGDYAVNVSFLAKQTKMPPPKIAEALATHFKSHLFSVTVVGAYLNFKLENPIFLDALMALLVNPTPGFNDSLSHERILLEYVSANPTGPLHIGHGRWAALGDSLIRILRHCGAQATPEFYINDAGVQMKNIARSVYIRCRDVLLQTQELNQAEANAILSSNVEAPYPGEYVFAIAEAFLSCPEHKQALMTHWNNPAYAGQLPSDEALDSLNLIGFTRDQMLAEQQALLQTMRVTFDNWISEKAYLYDQGMVEKTLTRLEEKGYTYEAEEALWFKSTEFGDEKDRVLRKSDGSYTYLTPDIAYHDDKMTRLNPQGKAYSQIIDMWGADHHGYIPRMQGAITALGHDPQRFEVLLGQLVNLIVDGERTRMGKRRKMLTLQDVVDEVGVDATRFWMVSKSADTALDFDVALASSATSDNPVFYVQYAHARCCSILRNATEPILNTETGQTQPPLIDAQQLAQFETQLSSESLSPLLNSLTEPKDRGILNTLLLLLDQFEQTVQDAARLRAPYFIAQYCLDLSAQFHSFYGVCRILTPDAQLTLPRLMLIRAIQKTLAQALDLLGVTAPDQM